MKADGSASKARKPEKATVMQDGAQNAPKARPFRLKAIEPKEAQLQAAIIGWLRIEQAQGRVSWFCRVNGGMAKRAGGRLVKNYRLYLHGEAERSEGYADLHGMLTGGRYFALEVKRPGRQPTPEQRTFLDRVRLGGGIGAVVTNFDEAKAVLEVG